MKILQKVRRVWSYLVSSDVPEEPVSMSAWLPPEQQEQDVDLVSHNTWRGSPLAATARLAHVAHVRDEGLAFELRIKDLIVRAATPGVNGLERVRASLAKTITDLRVFVESGEQRSRENWKTLDVGFERLDARLDVLQAHVRGDVEGLTRALYGAMRVRAISITAAAYLLDQYGKTA